MKKKKIEEQRGQQPPVEPQGSPIPGYVVISHQDLDRIKGDIANLRFQMDQIKTLLGHVLSIRVRKKAKKKEQEDVLGPHPEG